VRGPFLVATYKSQSPVANRGEIAEPSKANLDAEVLFFTVYSNAEWEWGLDLESAS